MGFHACGFYLGVVVENDFELKGASRVVEKCRRKGLALFSKRLFGATRAYYPEFRRCKKNKVGDLIAICNYMKGREVG